jgi:hypothetical protein
MIISILVVWAVCALAYGTRTSFALGEQLTLPEIIIISVLSPLVIFTEMVNYLLFLTTSRMSISVCIYVSKDDGEN